jgi:hypothetical protein
MVLGEGIPPPLQRTREHSDFDIGHKRKHVLVLHAGGMRVQQSVPERRQPSEFPFHIDESRQCSGVGICTEAGKKTIHSLLNFRNTHPNN